MGVGLSEYRVAIGAFAWIATNCNPRSKGKTKQKKPNRLGKVDTDERIRSTFITKFNASWGSLERWELSSKGRLVKQRSKSLNQKEGRKTTRKLVSYRTRSQSYSRRENRKQNETKNSFNESCTACKNTHFNQRGRTRQRLHQRCSGSHQNRHISNIGDWTTSSLGRIEATKLFSLTCIAASGCFLLEQAIFSVVQMLLVRSGIETNPGPTTPTSSSCCNASQHFNRVKNTIVGAEKSFRSKVTLDTLTKKVVEIEETGIHVFMF